MEPLISVIVPIYNVEPYLRQCVDSIINQTYRNLEIILVDDGSPDHCGAICDEYAEKDERIVVLHKENGGLSDARNAGMRAMHGEYLMFVDSDDWLTEDCVERLYHLAEQNDADLVIGGVEKFEDETGKIIWSTASDSETVVRMTKQEAMKDTFLNGCASWARLYKTEVHKGIPFPIGEINEDEAIVLRLLERCKQVVKTNVVIYSYRYRNQSITSTTWHRKKLAWYEHCKANVEYVRHAYPELQSVAEQRFRSSLIWVLNNMTADTKQFSDLIPQYRKELQLCMKDKMWVRSLPTKERLRVYLLAYCYTPYAMALKMAGKHYT